MSETMTAAVDVLRNGLRESLPQLTDFSDFKAGIDDAPDPAPTASQKTEEDRGTPSTDQTKTGPKSEETKTEEKHSTAPDLPEKGKEEPQTQQQEKPKTEPGKPEPKVSRGEQRFREQAAEINRLKSELEAAKTGTKKEEPKAQEIPHLIPPPAKPQFTREQLKAEIVKYRNEGNQEMVEFIQEQIEGIRDYEIQMASWESKNLRAWENHQGNLRHYQQEAIKKFPEMNDANSEMGRSLVEVVQYAKQNFPNIMGNPLMQYFIPQVANWRMMAGKTVAAENRIKELEKELGDLKKGFHPLDQKSASAKGESKTSDVGEARNRLKDFAGRLGSLTS